MIGDSTSLNIGDTTPVDSIQVVHHRRYYTNTAITQEYTVVHHIRYYTPKLAVDWSTQEYTIEDTTPTLPVDIILVTAVSYTHLTLPTKA